MMTDTLAARVHADIAIVDESVLQQPAFDMLRAFRDLGVKRIIVVGKEIRL